MIGKIPGMIANSITFHERNARPMKPATKTISIVSPRDSRWIIAAELRAAMTARPVTEIW